MIDDKLPMGYSSPKYTKMGPNGAWWGPLLEKAAAKYYGHYQRMSGGWMPDAWDMLTAQPSSSLSTNLSVDQLWASLLKWEEAKMVMSTGCFTTYERNADGSYKLSSDG